LETFTSFSPDKYFFRPNYLLQLPSGQELTQDQDFAINSIEKIIYKSAALQASRLESSRPSSDSSQANHDMSNYLLSFYEYCRTLYDYFRENNSKNPANASGPAAKSCFSILDFSPASLICKLLFEDSIKPQLIEPLTEKLNLNLTAIILHSSCPR
jgi:hypothetical protein